jgi:hypothetical protein
MSTNGWALDQGLWRRCIASMVNQPVVLWLVLGAAGVGLHAVVPFECPFRAATGWDCPACGGTRALGNALHGHFVGAVRDNVVVILVGVVIVLGFIPGVRTTRFGKAFHSLVSSRSPFVWVALIIAWTLLRNLPALTWLSPDR